MDSAGVTPLPSSVAAIKTFPPPHNTKQLMSYLGMLNFYTRFIPQAAKVLKTLTDALKGKPQKDLAWSDQMRQAFALCHVATLAHPDLSAAISLAVDASNTQVGAVLFSKKLDPSQQKYSALDWELLACYLGVRHFRHHLEGRNFFIETAPHLRIAQSF